MQSNTGKQKIVKTSAHKNMSATIDGKRLDKKGRKAEYNQRKQRKERNNTFED